MGLLDKLKPMPRWKHADPSVRLDAVRDLDDAAELATLAETDPDARVRRAAVSRTADAAVLGRVATVDADCETRDRAADRLVALATAGADEATALSAIRALSDVRRLSAIARSDAPEAIRIEALVRTTDERALGGIARHAKHETIAAAALDRLTDSNELVDVAQNGEHKDVAVAALEKILATSPDIALVKSIDARTQQKPVSRRARAWIHDVEAAEAARRAAEEEQRSRETAACEAIEKVSELADPAAARAELARVSDTWSALGAVDQAMLTRFVAGVEAAQATIVRLDREARSRRATRSACGLNLLKETTASPSSLLSMKSGDRSRRSSVMARRPSGWLSDSPGQWLRAGRGTRWAPCWRRRARHSTRSSWKPKGSCRTMTQPRRPRACRRSPARHAATPPCSKARHDPPATCSPGSLPPRKP
jgi:hypothetical protein